MYVPATLTSATHGNHCTTEVRITPLELQGHAETKNCSVNSEHHCIKRHGRFRDFTAHGSCAESFLVFGSKRPPNFRQSMDYTKVPRRAHQNVNFGSREESPTGSPTQPDKRTQTDSEKTGIVMTGAVGRVRTICFPWLARSAVPFIMVQSGGLT